ncbi:MAG: hypothetical protein HS126_00850 [Anaerolineales bacterium]|nr:hypothetical protein [Anaerolineales bacterium]
MEEVQIVSDRVDRIKGLLRSDTPPKYAQRKASVYPNPALLVPAQAAEIQTAYEAALETPIGFRARPHLVLALILYRFGFNPGSIYNAVPLAEWVLKSYWQAHPAQPR